MKKIVLIVVLVMFCAFTLVAAEAETPKEEWLAMTESKRLENCTNLINGLPLAPLFFYGDLGGSFLDRDTTLMMMEKAMSFASAQRSLTFWKILFAKMDTLYADPKNESYGYALIFWQALEFMNENNLMDVK